MRLSHRDYKQFLKCIEELTDLVLLEDFPLRAIAVILKLVSCDGISYNEMHPKRFVACRKWPEDVPEEKLSVLGRYIPQHPLWPNRMKKHAQKITDYMPADKYFNTEIYNEYYKYMDVKYQMAIALPSNSDITNCFALDRSLKDLSERDRAVLDMLNPILSNCYRNAQAFSAMKRKLESSGHVAKGFRSIPGSGLTRREAEILKWVSWGKSNREIAMILGISSRTVQKHLEHIYFKLGVENRTAAAALAVTEAEGIITLSPFDKHRMTEQARDDKPTTQ